MSSSSRPASPRDTLAVPAAHPGGEREEVSIELPRRDESLVDFLNADRDLADPTTLPNQRRTKSIRNQTTFNWLTDLSRFRRYSLFVLAENKKLGAFGVLRSMYHHSQAYLVLMAVAFVVALSGAFMQTVSNLLVGLRDGYCKMGFWIARDICCFGNESPTCADFVTWADHYAGPEGSSASRWWTDFAIYVSMGTGMALLCGVLLFAFSPYAAGGGVPEIKTILGGFIIRGFLGGWTLVIKSLGLVLSVGSGLPSGKEGPMVHIASCWGNLLCRYFSKYSWNEAKKREIISCAAAAGVAVAFGAPLGGVLYSLEELASYFPHKTMFRAFFTAIMAKIFYLYANPTTSSHGKQVLFQVDPRLNEWEWFDMGPFILLGVVGGVVGGLFVSAHMRLFKFRERGGTLYYRPFWQIFVVSIVVLCISFNNIYLKGNVLFLLEALFSRCPSNTEYSLDVVQSLCRSTGVGMEIFHLVVAGLLRIVFLTVTLGLLMPVDVMLPSMAAGACLGRAMGMAIEAWHAHVGYEFPFGVCKGVSPCIIPRLYALVGAASLMCGTLRGSVSFVVIMFEVTGGLEYILPIMIATTVARWVGDAISAEGIVDRLTRANGFPLLDVREEPPCDGTAEEIMTPYPVFLTCHDNTLRDVQKLLETQPFSGYPVVNNAKEQLLYGYVLRIDLVLAMEEVQRTYILNTFSSRDGAVGDSVSTRRVLLTHSAPASIRAEEDVVDMSTIVDRFPVTVSPATPSDRLFDLFVGLGLSYLLVEDGGKCVGVIKKKDFIVYMDTKNKHFVPKERKGDDARAVEASRVRKRALSRRRASERQS
jgi:chloride channel 3/4/5